MAKRIFVWVAHPRETSLCASLGDAYGEGAEAAGASLRRIDLHAMDFDAGAGAGYGHAVPPLEPALIAWQEAVAWADHLLVVHPYWWGAMPARAKAVLDRALLPGFGFKYHARGLMWDRLLTGRTADTIITSDTPPWYDTLAYRRPGRRVLRNQVLEFCGIQVRRQVQFGPVKTASPDRIAGWLAKARRMGGEAAARQGARRGTGLRS